MIKTKRTTKLKPLKSKLKLINYKKSLLFENAIYNFMICISLLFITTCIVQYVDAKYIMPRNCNNTNIEKINIWPYEKFMKNGFKEIFDKMGFFCRNFGKFCSGKEYSALNPNDKKAIDIWNKNGKYGDYFSFLPDNIIEYFCNIVYPYETKECEFQNILKCAFPDKTLEFCPPYINYFEYMNFLSECNRAK